MLPEATLGRVTRANHSLEAAASRPTREGTLQVELREQRFSIVPTLAWDTSSERKGFLNKQFLWAWPASAFSIRGIHTPILFQGSKTGRETRRGFLPVVKTRGLRRANSDETRHPCQDG